MKKNKNNIISVSEFIYFLSHYDFNDPNETYYIVNRKEKRLLGLIKVLECPDKLVSETVYRKEKLK